MYKYILKHIDKLAHFSVSYFLVTFGYIFFKILPIATPLLSIVLLTALIGFSKEIYDNKKKAGAFDKYDLLADATGIIMGTLQIFLLMITI